MVVNGDNGGTRDSGRMTRNGGSRPVPDPTVLTTEQLNRAISGLEETFDQKLEVLRERLTGIDRATELRLGGILEIPAQIDEKVGHLKSVTDERFHSIATQFNERDTRSEREARDNKLAVDAAFAAQEKQAVAQQESNTLAIDKSEKSTAETIKTNQDLAISRIEGLIKSLDEVKLRVNTIESAKSTITEAGVTGRTTAGLWIAAAVGIIGGFIGVSGIVLALLLK